MREAAAEGAAITGLEMPDLLQTLVQDRAKPLQLGTALQRPLARHGPDLDLPAVDADVGKLADSIQVDEVIGHHITKVQHRPQGLPAGQELRVFQRGEQAKHVGEIARIVILERSGVHVCFLPSQRKTRARIAAKSSLNAETGLTSASDAPASSRTSFCRLSAKSLVN